MKRKITKSWTRRGVLMCNYHKKKHMIMTKVTNKSSSVKSHCFVPKRWTCFVKCHCVPVWLRAASAGHSNHHSLSSVWCLNTRSSVSQLCNSFKIHHKDHYSHCYHLSRYIKAIIYKDSTVIPWCSFSGPDLEEAKQAGSDPHSCTAALPVS